MPRRRHRSGIGNKVFTTMLCIILPLGLSALLIAAAVSSFSPHAELGMCHPGPQTAEKSYCSGTTTSSSERYRATLVDIKFSRESKPNETCTWHRTFESEEECTTSLAKDWAEGAQPHSCWFTDGRTWWLAPTNRECTTDPPTENDTFDRTLPLTSAIFLLVGATCFWAPKLKRWWTVRNRRARRAAQQAAERSPLLERGSVPCVVRHGTVDLFSVSAVWTGEDTAAVLVGNAEGGAYPCEVQRVYDVGTTLSGECVVCLEFPKAVVLWPCRHLCVCTDCAPRLKRCPICRSVIRRRLCLELTQMPTSEGTAKAKALEIGDMEADSSSEEEEEDVEEGRGRTMENPLANISTPQLPPSAGPAAPPPQHEEEQQQLGLPPPPPPPASVSAASIMLSTIRVGDSGGGDGGDRPDAL